MRLNARIRRFEAFWIAITLFVVGGRWASAVETEFWQPYRAGDGDVFLLAGFEEDSLPQGTAAVKKMDSKGGVRPAEGRFGRGLRFDGTGALRLEATGLYRGGHISIEAWVWLDRYPENRAYLVARPAKVDRSPAFDPAVDVTKGFGLLVDRQGSLVLEITNLGYGKTIFTSSKPGAVPLGRWVHVAGVNAAFPVGWRRLFVDGREVAAEAITWGQGLVVHGEEETQPGAIYLGNNSEGTAGFAGRLDQVRIHPRIAKFWSNDEDRWTQSDRPGPAVEGPPHFLAGHAPVLQLPLDGTMAATGAVEGLQVQAGKEFVAGVRGQALRGPLQLRAPRLLDLNQGAIVCWVRPGGANSYSDWNHGFLSGPATLYIMNSPGLGFKPLSLYFRKAHGDLQFIKAEELEVHPGRWYHFAVTWRDDEVALYVDGTLRGRSFGTPLALDPKSPTCNHLVLGAAGSLVDEVALHPKALSPEEVANSYRQLRDPARLVAAVARSVRLRAQFFPSAGAIEYRLLAGDVGEAGPPAEIRLRLVDAQGTTLGETTRSAREVTSPTGPAAVFPVPDRAGGPCRLVAEPRSAAGKPLPPSEFSFRAVRFPWQGQRLGITDEVYPPFEPIRVEGNRASLAGRRYTFGPCGLLDQVQSAGKDLLAQPMEVRFTTAEGTGKWIKAGGKFATVRDAAAVYEAEAAAEAVQIRTRSTLEVDGCMKVEMSLLPGPKPAPVERLWVEIPLQNDQVRLMHTVTAGLRQNYSGAVPAGEGLVWDGSKAHHYQRWLNAFVPYIWLGTPHRGIAWFAENDRGWLTQKTPEGRIQELVRQGDRLTLRVYLVNRPAIIRQRQDLVFGLQASPTKPMPADWRLRLPQAPGGLAVVPWGGLDCASQAPIRDDWRIVDKILEPRQGRPVDADWFRRYAEAERPPAVHGNWPWLDSVLHFAGRAKDVGPSRPLAVYQEEMRGCPARPEWVAFQDEWTTEPHRYHRDELPDMVFARGYRGLAPPEQITFPGSYQDFGCSIAQEWLRRGVSLYWDNTYPYASTNPRTSAAYRTEDGRVQPAMVIWNHREYGKRAWNLLAHWRKHRPEPLEFTLHMTNTLLLPVHTWGTVNLDHELGSKRPFAPEWLQTETVGRQVGNLPLSLYAVSGSQNELTGAMPARQRDRIEWGMRAVHEIQRSGPEEKLLADFGYGSGEVRVHNYWDERPRLQVEPSEVKWLALEKKSGEWLVVLASWSERPVSARVALSHATGASGRRQFQDAETGTPLPAASDGSMPVEISGPWGNRLVRIAAPR